MANIICLFVLIKFCKFFESLSIVCMCNKFVLKTEKVSKFAIRNLKLAQILQGNIGLVLPGQTWRTYSMANDDTNISPPYFQEEFIDKAKHWHEKQLAIRLVTAETAIVNDTWNYT